MSESHYRFYQEVKSLVFKTWSMRYLEEHRLADQLCFFSGGDYWGILKEGVKTHQMEPMPPLN